MEGDAQQAFSKNLVPVDLPGMKDMLVIYGSVARNVRQLYSFIHQHTQARDAVLFFPDLGVYHFIVDRPFVGRFPMVTPFMDRLTLA